MILLSKVLGLRERAFGSNVSKYIRFVCSNVATSSILMSGNEIILLLLNKDLNRNLLGADHYSFSHLFILNVLLHLEDAPHSGTTFFVSGTISAW